MIRIGIVDLDTSHPVSFAKVLAGMPEVVIAAVYDHGDVWPPAARMADRYAQEHGGIVVSKPADMIGDVDGVMVLGQNWDRHLERALPFLEAGVATFIDKPVAGRLCDGIALQDAARRGKAPLMGGSSARYAVEVTAMRDRLQELGAVVTAYATGPGDFFNYGIHTVEMLHGAIGGGIRAVRFLRDNGPALFELTYGDGKIAILQLHTPGTFRLTVCGKQGSASTEVDSGKMYPQLLTRFIEMVRSGEPAAPFAASFEAVTALLAARRARATGHTVYVDDLGADEGFDGDAFVLEYARQRRAQ